MLDAFTGTCRCDLPAREQARSRRLTVPPDSAWRLACLEGVAGVGYRVVRHGEGAPIQPGDTLRLRVAGWAEDGTWLTPWTTPDVQSVRLSQMLPALATILLRERIGARVVACLPVAVLYGAPAGQALVDGGGQTLVLDMEVVARDAQEHEHNGNTNVRHRAM
jgi:FKBP-type peptidyl-prolyl cis-trans isomerases 1